MDIKKPDEIKKTQCFLGLGGNITNALGTPAEHIANAITTMQNHPKFSEVQASSLYESAPFGVTDQPNFVNAVVGVQTSLTAHELLNFCQSLENNAKRERLRHWGERSLDVDVLLYGDEVINTPDLTVPHAGLLKRNFVLVPLAELADKHHLNINIQGKSLDDLALSKDWEGLNLLD